MEPIEKTVLIYATEIALEACRKQEFYRLVSQVKHWDTLIDLSIKEGLAGLLYKQLLNSGTLATLDPLDKEKLRSRYYRNFANNLKYVHAVKQLLPQLERRRAQVILLKGIALLGQVYRDPGLRPMSDADLWVMKKDYDQAVDVLITDHFHRDSLYPNTFRKKGVTIDLHTHFLGADRIRYREAMLKLSPEQIFAQTRKIEFDGTTALCLGHYDQIIYLCLHALKHNAERLVWLADIKYLTLGWPISQWQALGRRADEAGQSKSVAAVLFLLKHLLAYPIPQDSPEFRLPSCLTHLEKKLLNLRIKKGALPDWAPLIFFSTSQGVRNRLLFTLETLFPQPEILRQTFQNYPTLNIWQLYVMRFFQLACRALALIIRR